MRDENGFLILDDYEVVNNFTKGRKIKKWLKKDNQLYLFKIENSFYEAWAEVFASEIGKQCKFDIVDYDIAIKDGCIGVISRNFLQKDELIISGENIIKDSNFIIKENNINIDVNTYHSVESVIFAIAMYTGSRNTDKILKSLINLWCFDGLLMESDRNPSNWSLIRKNNSFRLSPIYDCATIARLNNDISTLLYNLNDYGMIGHMTDNIKYSLTLHNGDKEDDFLSNFKTFCEIYPEYSDDIMSRFMNVDINKAINNIEKKINKNKTGKDFISMPYEVAIWINKVINFRLKDMFSIYNDVKKSKNQLIKKI